MLSSKSSAWIYACREAQSEGRHLPDNKTGVRNQTFKLPWSWTFLSPHGDTKACSLGHTLFFNGTSITLICMASENEGVVDRLRKVLEIRLKEHFWEIQYIFWTHIPSKPVRTGSQIRREHNKESGGFYCGNTEVTWKCIFFWACWSSSTHCGCVLIWFTISPTLFLSAYIFWDRTGRPTLHVGCRPRKMTHTCFWSHSINYHEGNASFGQEYRDCPWTISIPM